MASRIYIVSDENTGKKRMVDASSQWQAIKFCTKPHMKAKAATAKDVAVFITNGGKIENPEEVQA